eukprot:1172773-Prorocentrum_minimum.AAC.1
MPAGLTGPREPSQDQSVAGSAGIFLRRTNRARGPHRSARAFWVKKAPSSLGVKEAPPVPATMCTGPPGRSYNAGRPPSARAAHRQLAKSKAQCLWYAWLCPQNAAATCGGRGVKRGSRGDREGIDRVSRGGWRGSGGVLDRVVYAWYAWAGASHDAAAASGA